MNTYRIVIMAILILGIAGIAPVAAEITTVANGGVVFVGEQGLTFQDNTAAAIPAGTTLEWFAAGDDPMTDSPSATYICQGPGYEVISPMIFQTRTGNWYLVDRTVSPASYCTVIEIKMPAIDVRAYNSQTGEDMTNMRVVKDGGAITFRLDSNLHEALLSRPNIMAWDSTGIKVVVVDEEGTTYTGLVENAVTETVCPLTQILPVSSQYYLPDSTGASGLMVPNWDLDSDQYKVGTYTFYAQVNLNGLKDNLGTVTGVTKSEVKTLDVSEDFVTVETNKASIIRNDDFSVTITGRPNENYVLWVKGTSNVCPPDTVPYIKPNQNSVTVASAFAGAYVFSGLVGGTTVVADVCAVPAPAGDYYAMVTLSSYGNRTVGFATDDTTKDQSYTIRADLYQNAYLFTPKYDTATVQVSKGDITITASGVNPYSVEDQITLSGTNTDSDGTWLFITGPDLKDKGVTLFDLTDGVVTGGTLDSNPAYGSWAALDIAADDTWKYEWNITRADPEPGTYTIYAVTTPVNHDDLAACDAIYSTATIIIEEPHVTATASSATIAKGDPLAISGTAVFDETGIVPLWVFGSAYMNYIYQTTDANGTFAYTFPDTTSLPAGTYTCIAQHPMYNNLFDLVPQGDNPAAGQTSVVRPVVDAALVDPTTGNLPSQFIIEGTGCLQGSDAALALTNAMNNTDVDDTYYKLIFTVEEPWITIATIGDKYVGDKFTVTGTTNLAVGNSLNITLTPSGETTPVAANTVVVTPGITTGVNIWEIAIDTATYSPDDYVLSVKGLDVTSATATQTFTLLEPEPIPPTPETITVTLPAGWSLISTPVDEPVITVTGSLCENAYTYNTTTDAYETVALTKILPGGGYWIGAFKDSTIKFTGVPLTEYQKSLSKDWNLIGGIGIATDIESINITPAALSGPLYQYNPATGLYSQASALNPGEGYWASSAESCTITVTLTPPPAPA